MGVVVGGLNGGTIQSVVEARKPVSKVGGAVSERIVAGAGIEGLGEQHATSLFEQLHCVFGMTKLDRAGGGFIGQSCELTEQAFLIVTGDATPGNQV